MKKRILIGNIFDVGGEFNPDFYEKVYQLGDVEVEKIQEIYSNYFIKLKLYPYKVNLEDFSFEFENQTVKASVYAKIYPYGAIILFLDIETDIKDYNQLFKLFWIKEMKFENRKITVKEFLLTKYSSILDSLKDYVKKDYISPEFIDEYRIFIDNEHMDNDEIVSLLINEPRKGINKDLVKELLSPETGSLIGEKVIVTPLNSYVRFNNKEEMNIISLIELGYVQIYELKVYDYLLDEYIEKIYSEVENYKFKKSMFAPTIFSKRYSRLIKNAISLLELRVDIVDLIRDISNALKVTDDVYYSHVYTHIISRVRFNSWYNNINIKLEEIEKFNAMLREEGDIVRSTKLEFWIILLFIVEIVMAIDYFQPSYFMPKLMQFIEYIKSLI